MIPLYIFACSNSFGQKAELYGQRTKAPTSNPSIILRNYINTRRTQFLGWGAPLIKYSVGLFAYLDVCPIDSSRCVYNILKYFYFKNIFKYILRDEIHMK